MKLKLKIKKLAQIEDGEIEVKPFTIFFGKSNTNKSYTLFALYNLFRPFNISSIGKEFVKDLKIIAREKSVYPPSYSTDAKEKIPSFIKITVDANSVIYSVKRYFRENLPSFFKYLISAQMDINNVNVDLEVETIEDIIIYYRPHFPVHELVISAGKKPLIQLLKSYFGMFHFSERKDLTEENVLIRAFPFIYKYVITGETNFIDYYYLLPPARGSFFDINYLLLDLLVRNYPVEEYPITGLMKEFLSSFIKTLPIGEPEAEIEEELQNLLRDIFEGDFRYDRATGQIIYSTSSGEIPVSAASSSVRELAPLYFVLRKKQIESGIKRIFIEEPEAHLHPSLQIKIAYLLSYVVRSGGNVFLTTHSDYFIGALNNLIKLWNIKKLDPKLASDLMKKYGIREEYLVSPEDIAVYLFKKKDNQKVKVERIDIGDYGIPLESFRDTINFLSDMTDELHYKLFKLKKSSKVSGVDR